MKQYANICADCQRDDCLERTDGPREDCPEAIIKDPDAEDPEPIGGAA